MDLRGNPLSRVEANAFEMVPQLVSLDLSQCGLRRVAARAFAQLQQLQKLDLSGNQLAELKPKTVDTVRGLHAVELSGNPWRCDCKLRPLKQWLVRENVPLTLDAVCAEPNRIRGKRFRQLGEDEFACPPKVRPGAPAAGFNNNNNKNNNSSTGASSNGGKGSMGVPRYVEAKSGERLIINLIISARMIQ